MIPFNQTLKSNWTKLKSSPLLMKIIKGTFWSLIGSVFNRGIMLLSSIYVARFLGVKSFGEYGVIQSTIGLFAVVASFGLGLSATKFVAEYQSKDPQKTGRIIGFCNTTAFVSAGFMSVILYLSSSYLAMTINAPQLSPLLQISAYYLFFFALNGLQNGILAGFEAFKSIAVINLLAGSLSFPIMIFGTYFWGLKGTKNTLDLIPIVREIKKHTSKEIWIYSGYTWEELMKLPHALDLLKECHVLVDGRFVERLKDLTLRFRGSSNQRVINIQKSLEENNIVLYLD